MRGRFPLGAGRRVLQKTPFGFDASVWEFGRRCWRARGCVLARPADTATPRTWWTRCAARRITALQLVPALLAVLADEPGLEACASLRPSTWAARRWPRSCAARSRAAGVPEVLNLYGPTEGAI